MWCFKLGGFIIIRIEFLDGAPTGLLYGLRLGFSTVDLFRVLCMCVLGFGCRKPDASATKLQSSSDIYILTAYPGFLSQI